MGRQGLFVIPSREWELEIEAIESIGKITSNGLSEDR